MICYSYKNMEERTLRLPVYVDAVAVETNVFVIIRKEW